MNEFKIRKHIFRNKKKIEIFKKHISIFFVFFFLFSLFFINNNFIQTLSTLIFQDNSYPNYFFSIVLVDSFILFSILLPTIVFFKLGLIREKKEFFLNINDTGKENFNLKYIKLFSKNTNLSKIIIKLKTILNKNPSFISFSFFKIIQNILSFFYCTVIVKIKKYIDFKYNEYKFSLDVLIILSKIDSINQ